MIVYPYKYFKEEPLSNDYGDISDVIFKIIFWVIAQTTFFEYLPKYLTIYAKQIMHREEPVKFENVQIIFIGMMVV